MRPQPTFAACILLTCFAAPVFGQIRSGTIVRKVSDPSGAALTGVQVTVREINTNATFTVETNETGEYLAPYNTCQFGKLEYAVPPCVGHTTILDPDVTSEASHLWDENIHSARRTALPPNAFSSEDS